MAADCIPPCLIRVRLVAAHDTVKIDEWALDCRNTEKKRANITFSGVGWFILAWLVFEKLRVVDNHSWA
jgi:hypothetical protein